MPLRLNLGCGARPRPGFSWRRPRRAPGVDIVADLNAPFTDLPNDCVAEVFTRHTLEHVERLLERWPNPPRVESRREWKSSYRTSQTLSTTSWTRRTCGSSASTRFISSATRRISRGERCRASTCHSGSKVEEVRLNLLSNGLIDRTVAGRLAAARQSRIELAGLVRTSAMSVVSGERNSICLGCKRVRDAQGRVTPLTPGSVSPAPALATSIHPSSGPRRDGGWRNIRAPDAPAKASDVLRSVMPRRCHGLNPAPRRLDRGRHLLPWRMATRSSTSSSLVLKPVDNEIFLHISNRKTATRTGATGNGRPTTSSRSGSKSPHSVERKCIRTPAFGTRWCSARETIFRLKC